MPIKLSKVIRDLNVGITSVADFLHRKGHTVESNPNAKITDEQFEILVDEFGKSLSETERKRMLSRPAPEPAPVVAEKKPEAPRRPEEIKTEIPEDYRPKFVTKGKIDLFAKRGTEETEKENAPAVEVYKKEEKTSVQPKPEVKPEPAKPVAEEAKPEPETKPVPEPVSVAPQPEAKTPVPAPEPVVPKAAEPAEPAQKDVPQTETPPASVQKENREETVFRLNKNTLEPAIKVTGKIDLAAINQSTRPKKKSREQKRRERVEKRKASTDTRKPAATATAATATTAPPPPKTDSPDKQVKKKRKRIRKDKVDITAVQHTSVRPPREERKHTRLRKPVKAEISEEDVQKQIKETLARLTSKSTKSSKGAKYRRDKRDAAEKREQELQQKEERESKVLKLTEFVTANDLANMMNISVSEVISTCMSIGIMVSINQRLDAETINIVADEFGFKTEYVSAEVSETIREEEDSPEDYTSRPPIVTVMGHVDHGKTSLLDNIRNANVIAGEAGGITQHIGAYNVKLPNGRRITFLDTPGHEAFTAMRARGAKVTDIVIIIVAADDNVMPQTVEAINHASVAGVPIVFAINKIDKPGANSEKIREELSKMNYLVEDWGGKYQCQEISAKKGVGIQELLEKVLLEADMLELKANPKKRAMASIIESSLDKGRGYMATVLVSNGTLRQGDVVLAGTHYGRVKAMFNERNLRVDTAGPSEPVLILGLDGAPQAGDTLNVLESEQEAREIAGRREQLQRELGLRTQKRFGLEELGRRRALGDFHELKLIVKGDVDGSVEALSDSLIKLSTEEIQVIVIHKAVGQISDSDIDLSASSDAVIIGFQVRPATSAHRLAEKEGVEIRLYSIIYDAIEDVKSAMEGMLSPEIREDIIGNAEVQQVFKISKVGAVAGCIVKEGKVKRTNRVRVIRDGIVIHTGELASLKRFKDEVKEAVTGQDCGIHVANYNDIQAGDIIESFDQTEVKKTL
ncbi:MAG: translation initiation factor IF-2 [Tannerella sp.]|nr:translation initiation factor IF-2 [Tannerella sp.]